MGTRQDGPRGFEVVEEPSEPSSAGSAPPPITFTTFVLSLSTSALMHLGVRPPGLDEAEPLPPIDKAAAQQVIEILEMVHQKTEGNLESEEAKLLEQLLHELHMRFVEAHPAE